VIPKTPVGSGGGAARYRSPVFADAVNKRKNRREGLDLEPLAEPGPLLHVELDELGLEMLAGELLQMLVHDGAADKVGVVKMHDAALRLRCRREHLALFGDFSAAAAARSE
jgi:hypothetical protein